MESTSVTPRDVDVEVRMAKDLVENGINSATQLFGLMTRGRGRVPGADADLVHLAGTGFILWADGVIMSFRRTPASIPSLTIQFKANTWTIQQTSWKWNTQLGPVCGTQLLEEIPITELPTVEALLKHVNKLANQIDQENQKTG